MATPINTPPVRPAAEIAHVRVVRRPRGRRGYSGRHFEAVVGAVGVNRNLCGADLTDRDITPRDVKAALALNPGVVCAACVVATMLAIVGGNL